MMEAEKWYEYQENYQKYGLDMKPKTPRKRVQKKRPAITPKDKARLLALLVIVGILCVGLIITTAYAATIKYDINQIIKANNALEAEVEGLNVKIYSANNIEAIEKKATKKLGMVYPKSSQVIYLSDKPKTNSKIAGSLKEQAYN